jgi:hypothetical protein
MGFTYFTVYIRILWGKSNINDLSLSLKSNKSYSTSYGDIQIVLLVSVSLKMAVDCTLDLRFLIRLLTYGIQLIEHVLLY